MPHVAKYTAISTFGVFLSIFGAVTTILVEYFKKYLKWIAAAVLFAATYFAYTDGILLQPDRFVIGKLDMQSDVPVFYNNIYLFEKKVEAGQSPLHNNMEMYPFGFNMTMNSHNFIMGIFCLPFNDISTGLNIGLWLSFILSGLGAALLCYRFVPNYWAAILAGFIFAFSPWKMIKLQDHHWFALTATLPFYIYHFIDVFDFTKRKHLPVIVSYKKLAYCFILGVLTALSEYYLTFFLIYFSIFYILIKQYIRPWNINFRKVKTWVIIALGVAGISTLVSVLDGMGWDNKGAFYWGGDLAAYFLPVYKQWTKDFIGTFGFEIPAYQENFFFLGFSFIAFAIAVIFIAKKNRNTPPEEIRSFAWLSLVFVLLSLPVLKVLGLFMFYLPTSIIHYLPFFNNVRVITRIFVLFSLLFPIVILAYFYNNVKQQTVSIISVLLLLILFVEYKPMPYQTIDKYYIPDEVFDIKAMEGEVVCPVPAGLRDGFTQIGLNNSDMLYFQTFFDKKIIGGYTARLTDKVREQYLADSVMKNILYLSENPEGTVLKATDEQVDKFFKTFSCDIFFIHPKYRATAAERYIFDIVAKKGYHITTGDEGKYLIMTRH